MKIKQTSMKNLIQLTGLAVVVMMLFAGCSDQNSSNSGSEAAKAENNSGLSSFEMVNGIGPVDEEITLNEINSDMVEKGAQIFKTKCSACHKMDDRYVGPALGNVLDDRTPTYVMNMILNPDQMVKEHPEAKKLLAEYMTSMPNQNLTQDEARAIVEYLASENQ